MPLMDPCLAIYPEEVPEGKHDIQDTIANAVKLTFVVVSAAVVLAIG